MFKIQMQSEVIKSRFDIRISYYLIICIMISFLTSLFALQLFVGILSILWLLEKVSEKKKSLDLVTYFILIFGLIRVIAVIFSHYQKSSVEIFYKEILFYLGFFSFVFYLKTFDLVKLRNILYMFISIAALIALTGVIRFNLSLVQRAQAFAPYTTFASYLLVAFAFAVSFRFGIESKFNNTIRILISTIILCGIITSLGRTVIAIAILILLASLIFKKLNYKSAFVIVLLTAVICFVSFNNNKTEITSRIDNPIYLSDRDVLYNGAKELVFKTPIFGFGPRTFHQTFPFPNEFNDKGVGGWHNDYFQIYFESGLLGLISYIALLTLLLKEAYFLIKKNKRSDFIVDTGFGIIFSLVGLILTAFTIGFITHVVLSIVFAFLIGLLSASWNKTGSI
jgi:O-antigen ligase